MKYTRHRCQLAPLSTVPTACFSPSCASEITRRVNGHSNFPHQRSLKIPPPLVDKTMR